MVLYNALGLLFVDCCSNVIDQLDFKRKNIFSYYPTKFINNESGWVARNDYKTEYHAFEEKLNAHIEPGNVVLKIDISGYFESIDHSKLVRLIKNFSQESALEKHNVSKDAFDALEFYFESMMQKKQGIPQGRKNFVSDYFGYLYLIPFDIKISKLANSKNLNFKSVVRYVDDIYLIFATNDGVSKSNIYRELLSLEQAISGWLYSSLSLSVNPEKTSRKIIKTITQKVEFIKSAKKAISSPIKSSKISKVILGDEEKEVQKQFELFKKALEKFRFNDADSFDFSIGSAERENLKAIFSRQFQAFVFKGQNLIDLKAILSKMDFDLTTDQINIIIVLFFLEGKNKNRPFYVHIENFLLHLLDLGDKRHIHIILAALAQNAPLHNFRKIVKRFVKQLELDNYGKYLLCFFDLADKKSSNCIYKRISRECAGEKTKKGTPLFFPFGSYESLIEHISNHYSDKQTLIQPLKSYVFERWNKRWDMAFNYLNNLFHELCKLKFLLNDKATSKEVLKNLSGIEIEDELLIMKFYDRRNFNAVSHPSQKGKPSVKVSEADFLEYENKILDFIVKNLVK